jgi:hypothetical protein
LVNAWRNIRQRAIREGLTKKIEFVAIFEETKKGWPHLHILARCDYLPQKWLSDRMEEYTGAPVVDIRRVWNQRHASRYVAKYVSKGPGGFQGTKRYWTSRWYTMGESDSKPVADANKAWWRTGASLESLVQDLSAIGWVVTEESANFFKADAMPGARWPWSQREPPDRRRFRCGLEIHESSTGLKANV